MVNWVLIIIIVIVGIGIIMSIFPLLPGIPLIFGTMLFYGIFEGFQKITPAFLIGMLLITIFSFFIDNLAGWLGAKRYGASKVGLWGAVVGGLLGVFINLPLGILLGPLKIFYGSNSSWDWYTGGFPGRNCLSFNNSDIYGYGFSFTYLLMIKLS